MIYIVEIPHQSPPKAWSRSNKEQIINVINESALKSSDTIYTKTTGRELLEIFSYESTNEMRADNDALVALADLIDVHGLDTTLYKGFGDGGYSIDPVDEWESSLKFNSHDLSRQLVYMSDKEARAALVDDSAWDIHQGVKARIELAEHVRFFGKMSRAKEFSVKNHQFMGFITSYIKSMLWSSSIINDIGEDEPLDQNNDYDDISKEALITMYKDCAVFYCANYNHINCEGAPTSNEEPSPAIRAGHDFWLTRCGHGSGFWDGNWPEPHATHLTDASKDFGNQDPYIGDDGKIYLS